MKRLAPLFVLALAACGGAQTHADSTGPAPADPAPAASAAGPIDERIACAADDECIVGSPGGCCAASCPNDRQAWNATAWAEQMHMCSVVECAVREEPACPDVPVLTATAHCVEGRCVLTTATAR